MRFYVSRHDEALDELEAVRLLRVLQDMRTRGEVINSSQDKDEGLVYGEASFRTLESSQE
jgi:hypothetical protein